MANSSFNFNEAFHTLTDAPMEKFIVLCLMLLVFWILHKFFKFIEGITTNFKTNVASFAAQNIELKTLSEAHVEALTKKFDMYVLRLDDWKRALLKELSDSTLKMVTDQREMLKEIEKAKSEIGKLQIQVASSGVAMPTVKAAIEAYQQKIDTLEQNFKMILKGLEERKAKH